MVLLAAVALAVADGASGEETISLMKTPNASDVCNGSNTQVTYTYVVTNNSDFFSVSGTLSDDQFGSVGSFGPLAPGASATLTTVATVNGTVTNTGTASGAFDDPASTSASPSASATVNGVPSLTDSSLCTFDVDADMPGIQFRLIFTPDHDQPSSWKLSTSNPGQFYYNILYFGQGITPVDITLPYPP